MIENNRLLEFVEELGVELLPCQKEMLIEAHKQYENVKVIRKSDGFSIHNNIYRRRYIKNQGVRTE